MAKISKETIENFLEIYIVSNTPFYLYKHFRLHPKIQQLSKEYSIEKLLAIISKIDQSKKRAINTIVIAYIATVALTFYNTSSVHGVLKSFKVKNLDWFWDIIKVWEDTRISMSAHKYDFKPDYYKPLQEGDISSSFSTFNYVPPIGEKLICKDSFGSFSKKTYGEED